MKDEQYWNRVRKWATEAGSDGCTLVTQLYQDCCFEHDHAYRTGTDLAGNKVSRSEADATFRRCIQSRSKLGKFSPISWVRWIGVRIGGRFMWRFD